MNKILTTAKMTPDQRECYQLLCDLMGGAHHVEGAIQEWGDGIYWNQLTSIATFDYNLLTVAVVLAHDRCIRLEIRPAGPKHIGLALTKRQSRDGFIVYRHPTIEDAIAAVRRTWKLPVSTSVLLDAE